MNSLMWGLYVFEESDGVCNLLQSPVAIHESCNDRLQGHPTDRFGKLSVQKTFNPL